MYQSPYLTAAAPGGQLLQLPATQLSHAAAVAAASQFYEYQNAAAAAASYQGTSYNFTDAYSPYTSAAAAGMSYKSVHKNGIESSVDLVNRFHHHQQHQQHHQQHQAHHQHHNGSNGGSPGLMGHMDKNPLFYLPSMLRGNGSDYSRQKRLKNHWGLRVIKSATRRYFLFFLN